MTLIALYHLKEGTWCLDSEDGCVTSLAKQEFCNYGPVDLTGEVKIEKCTEDMKVHCKAKEETLYISL